MISKKDFLKIMNEWKSLIEDERAVTSAMNKMNNQSNCVFMDRHWGLIESLLKVAIRDDNDWIMYFICELDWGKKDGKVKINGKKFKLRTLEDLYRLLSLETML